jgi:hypothetical protein
MAGPLNIIDGLQLPREYRDVLRPDESVMDACGKTHVLPRFFYQISSWKEAKELKLTAHIGLWELVSVDCREIELLLGQFPHYVPCSIVILARYLEEFRQRVEAPVYVSVNGGYRSPAHRLCRELGCHNWGTAANIYRVGDTFIDSENEVEHYGEIATSIGPEVFVKPYGHGPEETDDHLHLDIGYVRFVPKTCDERTQLASA